MRAVSCVSFHSQIMASSDTSGRDTMSAPKAGALRETSDTIAMMRPDSRALMMRYVMNPC